ncbi:hypothetical protein JCM6882_001495 [Rhodosporidiobolus microsporus]
MSSFIGRRSDGPSSSSSRRDGAQAGAGGATGGGGGASGGGGPSASLRPGVGGGLPATGQQQQEPLPVLPDDLLDALAREPPPSPPRAEGGANGRASLSFSRPNPPISSSSGSSTFSAGLPTISPQSPFGLSYPSSPSTSPNPGGGPATASASLHQQQQEALRQQRDATQYAYPQGDEQLGGFSTNRTASSTSASSSAAPSPSHSPTLARTAAHGGARGGYGSGSALAQANPPLPQPAHPGLPRTSSGNILSAFSSSSSSTTQTPATSKRNMFKSFGFGSRSASSSPTLSRQTLPSSHSQPHHSPQQYLPTPPTPWQRSPSPSSPAAAVPSAASTIPAGAASNLAAADSVPAVAPGTFASSPSSHSHSHAQSLSRQSSYLRASASASSPAGSSAADSPALGSWPDSPLVGGSGRRRTIGGGAGGAGAGEEYTRDLERGREEQGDEESASEAGANEHEGEEPRTPRGGAGRGEPQLRSLGTVEQDFGGMSLDPPPTPQPSSSSSPPPLADFVIAVVGPRDVGKSTVIKRGLLRRSGSKSGGVGAGAGGAEVTTEVLVEDEVGNRATSTITSFVLSSPSSTQSRHRSTPSTSSDSSLPPSSNSTSKNPSQAPQQQQSQQRRTIQILEIDMHLLRYSKEGVVWPEGVPQCEGAMVCYDSTDPTSLTSLSTLLRAFWTRGSDVPLIVLACKASPSSTPVAPGSTAHQVDPKEAAAICNVFGAGIVQLDGGVEDPKRKSRECFNWLIRQIMDNRGEIPRPPSSASHSHSHSHSHSVSHSATHSASHSPSASRRHSLHASSITTPTTASSSAGAGDDSPPPAAGASGSGRKDSLGLGLSVVQEAPVGDPSSAAPATSPNNFPVSGVDAAQQAALDAEADAALRAAFSEAGVEDETREAPLSPVGTVQTATSGGTGGPERVALGVGTDRARGAVVLPQPGAGADRRGSKTAALDLYFSREDLIDKFLFAAVSGNDEQFTTLFLITYRRFARPFDVLEKLIERFEFVASRHKTDPLLSRYGQMKLCGVLSTWMTHYPGDFTAPSTFSLLQPFLESLLPRGATWVAHYALDLVPLLAPISAMADPESSWALPDKPLDEHDDGEGTFPLSPKDATPRPPIPLRRPSLAPSFDSSSSLAPSSQPLSKSVSRLSVPGSVDTTDTSAGVSPALGPSAGGGGGGSGHSPRPASEAGTLDTQDSTDAFSGPALGGGGGGGGGGAGSGSLGSSSGAGGLGRSAIGKYPSSAVLVDVSNAVMEMREEDVALQITRIAWEMFGGMSPRDLMRHVLAPRDPANPRVALRDSESNVMRSIAFVNYLASWTATLILVQSRPKQRARMVEKMLLIAVSLREQENFDGLMGVLAGLNSQPVFRLSETFELVATKLDGDPRTLPQRAELPDGDKTRLPKKLRSLNRLMAATKAFAAYRLALANSGVNMIPYLGVHLQDITVVNEVKSDLRDGLVNWSKFHQMGRSAAIVLDCARVAPQLPVDRAIERCVLHVPVLDDDQQYKLSYANHPRQGGKTGTRARLKEIGRAAVGL